MRYRAVFISPHLDDAVFSCAGAISSLVHEGAVLVLNIFDRYAGTLKLHAVSVADERIAEERRASEYLGFSSQGMGELDAVFRRPAYRSPANLFRPPVAEDLADLPRLRQSILDRLSGLDYQQLYIPLGIGWHVDHILTHRALQEFGVNNDALFYEDAPYCLIAHATNYRLRELGQREGCKPGLASLKRSAWLEWFETAKHYVGMAPLRHLKPLPVRWVAKPVVALYLWRLLQIYRERAHNQYEPISARPEILKLDESHFKKKIEAIWQYSSQASEFFMDQHDCATLYRDYARQMDGGSGYLERYWKIEAIK